MSMPKTANCRKPVPGNRTMTAGGSVALFDGSADPDIARSPPQHQPRVGRFLRHLGSLAGYAAAWRWRKLHPTNNKFPPGPRRGDLHNPRARGKEIHTLAVRDNEAGMGYDLQQRFDAFVSGEGSPGAFMQELCVLCEATPDSSWDVLALIDQYYRRGKLSPDVF